MGSSLNDFGEIQFTVEEIDSNIAALKRERQKAKEREQQFELAKTTREVFQSYIDAGFTKEQAWEIFITLMKK